MRRYGGKEMAASVSHAVEEAFESVLITSREVDRQRVMLCGGIIGFGGKLLQIGAQRFRIQVMIGCIQLADLKKTNLMFSKS